MEEDDEVGLAEAVDGLGSLTDVSGGAQKNEKQIPFWDDSSKSRGLFRDSGYQLVEGFQEGEADDGGGLFCFG